VERPKYRFMDRVRQYDQTYARGVHHRKPAP
jgi:hypothetical protein